MKAVFAIVGWLCIAFGTGSTLFAAYAFIDPAGAQLSNDAAPFDAPPSRLQIAFQFLFSLLVAAIGAGMVRRKKRS